VFPSPKSQSTVRDTGVWSLGRTHIRWRPSKMGQSFSVPHFQLCSSPCGFQCCVPWSLGYF
jgi:hypothetical protein